VFCDQAPIITSSEDEREVREESLCSIGCAKGKEWQSCQNQKQKSWNESANSGYVELAKIKCARAINRVKNQSGNDITGDYKEEIYA
jgi:hypothetical protein